MNSGTTNNNQHREFAYRKSPDQDSVKIARHPVIVIGAGPVGLSAAIDLARRGIATVLLDDDNRLSVGSRAICFAKRTLEIFDRLGCGQRIVDKGLSWNVGKVFFQDQQVYSFNLQPETGHQRPAFINLQQYHVEGYLHDHACTQANLQIRWNNKLTGLRQLCDGVELEIDTPDGAYRLHADYLIAADGSRSTVRGLLGLESKGQTFKDRFLIVDIKMNAAFPTERWFWFDPPFHRGQSVLLHHQPDDVWRVDFQLGWEADPVAEKTPERVIPRIKALLGDAVEFSLEWVSVYTFSCLRMEQFRHDRVLFAGDAAHCVSPFGARGANSGVQDADNLAWKLALVLDGKAPPALLDTYSDERIQAADENILNSTRATDFITPKSPVSLCFRNAVLKLAEHYPFARKLVNSGRLSLPATYRESTLNTPDRDRFEGAMLPGAPCADAPVAVDGEPGWFLPHIGDVFCGVLFGDGQALDGETLLALRSLAGGALPVKPLLIVPPGSALVELEGVAVIEDSEGLLAQRYDALPGSYYLLRPDQHVCARWRQWDRASVLAALARATCNPSD